MSAVKKDMVHQRAPSRGGMDSGSHTTPLSEQHQTQSMEQSPADPPLDDALRSLPPPELRQAARRYSQVNTPSSSRPCVTLVRRASTSSSHNASARQREVGLGINGRLASQSTWTGIIGPLTRLWSKGEAQILDPTGSTTTRRRGSRSQTGGVLKRRRRNQEYENRSDGSEDEVIVLHPLPPKSGQRAREAEASNESSTLATSSRIQRTSEEHRLGVPPLDEPIVPPAPNETTATALAKAASRNVRKARQGRKLQFAPEQKRVRKKDLPENFETGDLYRGLDDFIAAKKQRRREGRRRTSASRGSRGSRGSRSSAASLSAASSASSSSSSSSSDSITSGRGLKLNRIRAFFGDFSSSSSSSSSSPSSSSSSSSTPSGDSDNDEHSLSSSRIGSDAPGPFSLARFSRGRSATRSTTATRSQASSEQSISPPPHRDSVEQSVLGTPRLSRTPRTPRFAGQVPQNPRLTFATITGGAERARRRRKARRAKAHRARLAKSGLLPTRPSRKARHKAKELQEKAGGITEYTLFTPLSLPTPSNNTSTAAYVGSNADGLSTRADTVPDPDSPKEVMAKLMRTTQWPDVKERLRQYRHQLRQRDSIQGDLGVGNAGDDGLLQASSREERRAQRQRKYQRDTAVTTHKRARFSNNTQDDGDLGQMAMPRSTAEAEENFDLALPPPALSLPSGEAAARQPMLGASSTADWVSLKSTSGRGNFDVTFESERATGWHMSDVPLTPKLFGMCCPSRANRDANVEPTAHSATLGTESTPPEPGGDYTTLSSSARPFSAAWWLDISCPTYSDMVELSKLFPLHPLTVEDILQQEPREKVEIFQALGYYFANMRAVDNRYFNLSNGPSKVSPSGSLGGRKGRGETKHGNGSVSTQVGLAPAPLKQGASGSRCSSESSTKKSNALEMQNFAEKKRESQSQSPRQQRGTMHSRGRATLMEGVGGKEGLEGFSVGACNLYVIVFAHGLISFHTDDLSVHMSRVRRKLLDPAQSTEFTSDWIFHGLFDSIVDTFFPLVDYIEAEVADIEAATSEEKTLFKVIQTDAARVEGIGSSSEPDKDELGVFPPTVFETTERIKRPVLRPCPRIPISPSIVWLFPRILLTSRWVLSSGLTVASRRRLMRKWDRPDSHLEGVSAAAQTEMLKRISNNRKIITGLMRLLNPKHDTVRAARKRLADLRALPTAAGSKGGAWTGPAAEVSVHMGDVGDHVVSLFNLLQSGEGRLNETHTKYLVAVRINNRRARLRSDNALVVLATVTITALACTCWLSIWGMNCYVPNNDPNSGTFTVLAWVLGGLACIPLLVAVHFFLVKRSVRKKWEAKRKAR